MTDGAQARALVIAAKQVGQSAVGAGAPTGYSHLTLRVQFDDGTTSEITRWVSYAKLGRRVSEGSILPVRYDPDDRTTIEIDSGAVKRDQKAGLAEMKRRAVERGERQLAERGERQVAEQPSRQPATPAPDVGRLPSLAEIKAIGTARREGESRDER